MTSTGTKKIYNGGHGMCSNFIDVADVISQITKKVKGQLSPKSLLEISDLEISAFTQKYSESRLHFACDAKRIH